MSVAVEPRVREHTPGAVREVVHVAALIAAATAIVAIAVAVGLASEARHWLGFTFQGVPHTSGEALSILEANAKLAAAAGAAALIAQLRWHPGLAEGDLAARRMLDGLNYVCTAGLGVAVLANVVLVGASFGAYGGRMVEASLPHGPVELAGYSVAVWFYLRARRGRVPARAWAWSVAATVVLLAVAAVLETFAPLMP